jgi:hypothetical protein
MPLSLCFYPFHKLAVHGWHDVSNRSAILRKVMHKLRLRPVIFLGSVIQCGYTQDILVFIFAADIDQIASTIVPGYQFALISFQLIQGL